MKRYQRLSRIYVEQFGAWWSFDPIQWVSFAEKVESGYTLPDSKLLKNRPSGIAVCSDFGFWTDNQTHMIVRPINWGAEEWADHIESLYQPINTVLVS